MCDIPTVYQCDHPTARKEHICCECLGVISVGEKYNKHHGIWYKEPLTFKVCNDCEQLRGKVDKNVKNNHDRTPFEQLYESVFSGCDKSLILPYLNNARARKANIPEWMLKKEEEVSFFSSTENVEPLFDDKIYN